MTAYANDTIVEAYRKYLNRSPDPEGYTYWVEKIDSMIEEGKSTAEVDAYLKELFESTAEYKAINGLV